MWNPAIDVSNAPVNHRLTFPLMAYTTNLAPSDPEYMHGHTSDCIYVCFSGQLRASEYGDATLSTLTSGGAMLVKGSKSHYLEYTDTEADWGVMQTNFRTPFNFALAPYNGSGTIPSTVTEPTVVGKDMTAGEELALAQDFDVNFWVMEGTLTITVDGTSLALSYKDMFLVKRGTTARITALSDARLTFVCGNQYPRVGPDMPFMMNDGRKEFLSPLSIEFLLQLANLSGGRKFGKSYKDLQQK